MDLLYQVNMVGYQYAGFRKEIRRVVDKRLHIPRWKHWFYSASRIYAFVILVFGMMFLGFCLLGLAITFAQGEPIFKHGEYVPGMFLLLILTFVLPPVMPLGLIVGARKPDPIQDYLWPPEAPVLTVSFYEELIQVDDPRIRSQLNYASILAVMEAEAAYYLFVGQEHTLMLRKSEFTQGDPERFREFIAQKTVKPVEYVK